ncbi:MAG: cysteine--tRNA ligase [Pseudomonadota bacterium]
MISVYDTLRRKKVPFEPGNASSIGMYVCGPTVYDYCHVGHARVYVAFDVVFRYLKVLGNDVSYVRNITDIDDKIIARANETGEAPLELSARFSKEFHEDMTTLGCQPPNVEPRVSEHITDIVILIEKILDAGHAYVVGGDVYFEVDTFSEYGNLAARNLDELRAGARVELNDKKKNPLDFVLWKTAKPNEPAWDSPWGKGRPGWHIECSAMSMRYLGETFDIHGGGMDLIFPHHENELAQSQAAAGPNTFARYWLHNGFVNVWTKQHGDEKMSKSLGNFFTIREVCAKHEPEALRAYLLATNYRNPISFEIERDGDTHHFRGVADMERRLAYAYNTIWRLDQTLMVDNSADPSVELLSPADTFEQRFAEAMGDDFNTAAAFGYASELLTLANKLLDQPKLVSKAVRWRTLEVIREQLKQVSNVLGIFGQTPETFLARRKKMLIVQRGIDEKAVEALLVERNRAREAKDFGRADEIREQLVAKSIELMDGSGGTTWRVLE